MNSDLENLGERIAELAAHLDAATHRLLADLREFDARGQLSYSKVRALLRIATTANEAMVLEQARLTTAAQLEKLTRKYSLVQRHDQDRRPGDDEPRRYVRRRDTDDGMVKIEAVLHPEEAELVWTMLDHAAKQLAHERTEPVIGHDAVEGAAGCSTRDSAESGVATVAPGSAEAAPVHPYVEAPVPGQVTGVAVGSRAPSDDSAESGVAIAAARSAEAAPAHPQVEAPVPIQATEVAVGSEDPDGDSAESRVAIAAARSAETAPVGPYVGAPAPVQVTEVAVGSEDPDGDSAESGMVIAAARSAETAPPDPYVEAPGPVQVTEVAVGSEDPDGDSAESAAPERSLLDRLLDEAEATCAHDGMHHVDDIVRPLVTLSPVEVPAAEPGMLRQRADATRRAFQRADALISIAQAYLRGDRPQRAPIDVTVTIPAASLRRDALDTVDAGCIGDSCISAATARRLSCDAGVIEVVEDEHGVPLSVGRKRRTIAGSIKRALLCRDTTCSYPGCTNRTFLEGHHIEHWADGGATTLDNSALLCSHHHRYVHEYGYTIELGADRRPQFRDPRGRLVVAVPARPAGPELGWPQIYAMNEPLAIDAVTIACEWDGSRADYGRLVDELVTVDGLR